MDRKYVLTKLGAGDYLLPANDGQTIWRLSTYVEGPSSGLDEWPRDLTVWGSWRYIGPGKAPTEPEHLDWELCWTFEIGMCDTREEAIARTLEWAATNY